MLRRSSMTLFDPAGIRVEAHRLDSRVATFSVDVETDYGTGRTEALSQIGRFIDLMAALGVPWTAFVEGQFFETRRDLCRLLRDRGVDVQVHCYDHGQPGDTPAALLRSVAAYADLFGHLPRGYRAHTYRLTQPLYETLVSAGLLWDSSLMRAYAQGGNRHPSLKDGDYLVLADRLLEFPIATWRGVPLAFNHTHVLLLKRPGELALRAVSGLNRLVAYNCHMTDLVRSDSLRAAQRSPTVRLLYKYIWSLHGADTFPTLGRSIDYLKRNSYTFLATDELYRRVSPFGPDGPEPAFSSTKSPMSNASIPVP